jgi:Ser/Thr protein kinase RdoA (MazF antagonist)
MAGEMEQRRAKPADVDTAADAFGLGLVLARPVVAARGQQGLVWRVDTDRGRFAVKELLDQITEQDVAAEVAFQSTMAGRGVQAPRPVRTAAGAVLVPVGDVLFRAHTWVDLEPPRTDLDPEAVGVLLAALHRDPFRVEESVDAWYTDPVPVQEWRRLSKRLRAAGSPFATDFAASVPFFVSLQDVFRAPGATQVCHRDLWADNVRLTTRGDVCVIDWENCGPADPAQELAMVLVEFCYRDADRARRLYGAYRHGGGPSRLADRGDFAMTLAQFGHFAVTAAQQWLEAMDDGSRARAEAWFREGWEKPLGIDEIDEVLAAVRTV